MNIVPVPEDDFCWTCRCLNRQCYQDCPFRLPPNDPSLIGNDGRPRNKYDLYAQLIHFQHGRKNLCLLGRGDLADIHFFYNPPPPPQLLPPQLPLPQPPQLPLPQPPQLPLPQPPQLPLPLPPELPLPPLPQYPQPLLPVPPFQLSPGKRKRNEAESSGQSDLGIRPVKAATVLNSATEVDLAQDIQDLMMFDAAAAGSNEADNQQINMTNNLDDMDLWMKDHGLEFLRNFNVTEPEVMGSRGWESENLMNDTNTPNNEDWWMGDQDWAGYLNLPDDINNPLDFPGNAAAQGGANVNDHAGNQENAGGAPEK